MHRDTGKITLGTVTEFRMLGLTVPGIENAKDPWAQVCLPAGNALKLLLTIFEKLWKLDAETQAKLLKVSRSTLKRYRTGHSVPRRQEQLQRIEDLLRCHKALRVIFPQNSEAANTWLTRRNTRLTPSPVEYAMRHGTRGVRQYLETELAN